MDASENIQIYFGSKEKYTQFIEKIVKNNITKIVFVSKKNEETFYNIIDKKYIERNNIKTYVIKNYIDGDEILKKAEEEIVIEDNEKKELIKNILEAKKNNDNIKILLNVGRHSKEKNLNTMIEVFKEVIENSKNVMPYLVMLGDGKETDNIQKYIE